VDGLSCWDLNGNGIGDLAEDINSDGNYDALDCIGPEGPQGPQGPPGADGVDGADGSPGISDYVWSNQTDNVTIAPGGALLTFRQCPGSRKILSGSCTSRDDSSIRITYDVAETDNSYSCTFYNPTGVDRGGRMISSMICANVN
jgi:hypothetical protein